MAHLEKLVNYCEKAVREGATLVCGGHRVNRPGYFFQPTVFVDVEDHMFIATEEAFGPIMAISKFSSRYDFFKYPEEDYVSSRLGNTLLNKIPTNIKNDKNIRISMRF